MGTSAFIFVLFLLPFIGVGAHRRGGHRWHRPEPTYQDVVVCEPIYKKTMSGNQVPCGPGYNLKKCASNCANYAPFLKLDECVVAAPESCNAGQTIVDCAASVGGQCKIDYNAAIPTLYQFSASSVAVPDLSITAPYIDMTLVAGSTSVHPIAFMVLGSGITTAAGSDTPGEPIQVSADGRFTMTFSHALGLNTRLVVMAMPAAGFTAGTTNEKLVRIYSTIASGGDDEGGRHGRHRRSASDGRCGSEDGIYCYKSTTDERTLLKPVSVDFESFEPFFVVVVGVSESTEAGASLGRIDDIVIKEKATTGAVTSIS